MKKSIAKKTLTLKQRDALFLTLRTRFEKNIHRHVGMTWDKVQLRLERDGQKPWSLQEMERTGGEPDVVAYDKKTGEYIFFDCAPESPQGRRSLCYDPAALASRKQAKPKHSALGMAEEMGIVLLDEAQYHALQKLGDFDTKTSSWLQTPESIRELGGALFGDCRYASVFVYHNGAESYYAARGFRGSLRV
jgi:hypothetical protein